MKKVTFNVILRMPNYWSDGLLQIIDGKDIKALFTIDKAIGELKNGTIDLALLTHYIDLSTYNTILKGYQFLIDVGELCSPMTYYFLYDNNSQDYSIEFVSIEEETKKIKMFESYFN